MNKETSFKSLLSIIGFILTVASIIFAIWVYIDSKKQQKVTLSYYVENIENLFELKEKFPDLQVLYKNVPIEKSEKNIKIVTISLKNEGVTILQNFYDSSIPFGLRFLNCEIIKANITDASSEYLKDFQKGISSLGDSLRMNFLEFNKIILEKNSYVKIKVYLFATNTWNLKNIVSLGKLAGMDNFTIRDNSVEQKKDTLIDFNKIMIYYAIVLLALISLVVIMVIFIIKIENLREKRRIRKINEYFADKPKDSVTNVISDFFIHSFENYHKKIMNALISNHNVVININDFLPESQTIAIFDLLLPKRIRNRKLFISPMIIPENIFSIENGTIKIKDEIFPIVKELITFLKQKK
jgi:hypothetical protein